ncbi:hypothetical protein SALBM217S_01387 [Streptomyces griseoloalbus]
MSTDRKSVTSSLRPIQFLPAAASTTASRSPLVTYPMRVSTLPRIGTVSMSMPWARAYAFSCAMRRGEPVPMRARAAGR